MVRPFVSRSGSSLMSGNQLRITEVFVSPHGERWCDGRWSPVESHRLLRRHENKWGLTGAASQHRAALRSLRHTNRQGLTFGILF